MSARLTIIYHRDERGRRSAVGKVDQHGNIYTMAGRPSLPRNVTGQSLLANKAHQLRVQGLEQMRRERIQRAQEEAADG